MKSFLFAAALVAISAGSLFAQQCGSSCGTNQCGLNNRPRAAEPAAVPQAAPASLQSVAATEEWKAPEPFKVASYDRISGDAGSDHIEAQPVRGLNLFGVQVNRDNDNAAILADERAAIRLQEQRLADIERRMIDAQARGETVTYEEMQRAIAQIRPQMTPDEAWELTQQSPKFQSFMRDLLEKSSPRIGRVELVTVE